MHPFKILTLAALAIWPLQAVAKEAKCLMVVEGKVHIDGPCKFKYPLDVETLEREPRTTNSGESASVPRVFTQTTLESPGVISGYFGSGYALHAHDHLGTLLRQKDDRACWANDTAKLCVW